MIQNLYADLAAIKKEPGRKRYRIWTINPDTGVAYPGREEYLSACSAKQDIEKARKECIPWNILHEESKRLQMYLTESVKN